MATTGSCYYEWDKNPRMPEPAPPRGSCDCQFHIYDDPEKFPPRADAPYPPIKSATFAEAKKMHQAIGFERGVIVHSAIYGSDHTLLLHALEGLDDRDRYRGIGIVDDRVTDQELQRMHAAGVRGARFNFVRFLTIDQREADVRRSMARIRELGWHARLHVNGDDLLENSDLLRYGGRPVYYSDVIVRRDRPMRSFQDLRGGSWAYNEPRSHSGFNIVRAHLARSQTVGMFFATVVESGAHSASLGMVVRGEVDAAAIDSTVLEWFVARRRNLVQQVRVIDSFGPSPIPPLAITRRLSAVLRGEIRDILLRMDRESFGRVLLQRAGLQCFVAAEDRDYDPIRAMAQAAAEVSFPNLS